MGMTEGEIERTLADSVEAGLVTVVGVDEQGNDIYTLTERGRNLMEEYLDEALEQASVIFAEHYGVPLYIARDLLFKRAAELRALDT
jgi:DNA-binding PadR family transcriptional regulator